MITDLSSFAQNARDAINRIAKPNEMLQSNYHKSLLALLASPANFVEHEKCDHKRSGKIHE